MARPLRIEYPGAFYHITARGNERKDIFRDNKDRERYLGYFETAVARYRAGHLFQGRYKAILVDADTYAGELSRYIHLNPVRAGIAKQPEQYNWSSYAAYSGKAATPRCLNAFSFSNPHRNPCPAMI